MYVDTWMMFATPDKMWKDRAASASSSPASSSSGSSSHRLPSHNLFEVPHDRMHFPVFSPNMFNLPDTPGRSEETFQWNLEHIAELRPIHIDEKEIRRQMSQHSPDEEAELRAQRAIDYYFQHHMVAPSPWSETPPPHVLPVTPAYGQSYFGLMEETPNDKQGSIQKELKQTKNASDKSSQTLLTLPVDFDMEKVLGDYLTYQEGEDNSGRDSMSSSSLRRKLFFNADTSSILSPVRTGQRSPDHVSAALCTPPHPKKSTPEWERGSPINTPSSVQFSSSPIHGPLEGDYFRASFDHDGLASPELSPITEKHKGVRIRAVVMASERQTRSLASLFGEWKKKTPVPYKQCTRSCRSMHVVTVCEFEEVLQSSPLKTKSARQCCHAEKH
ncbi:protein aurora borealis-like isoform X2 [Littorina saxatilis]|uniref:protein aurora borealis-like isoform X2 n=1 Tax=Littorina saxatilis TaxID=31220 RepID=UPI0038B4ED83